MLVKHQRARTRRELPIDDFTVEDAKSVMSNDSTGLTQCPWPIEDPFTMCYIKTMHYAIRKISGGYFVSIEDMAKVAGYTVFHFHRKFHERFKITPKGFTSNIQMSIARKLLLKGEVSIEEISRLCGFAHQSHLTDRFKRVHGAPPQKWRIMERKKRAACLAN